jgi:hypothetical protein
MQPNKIMLAMPCMDRKMFVDTVMSLLAVLSRAAGAVQPYWNLMDSNIRHARNTCAHFFKNHTDCDTLFFLDSDIVFTEQDFAYMLEGDEPIVIAPYAKKIFGAPHTGFGAGFCRIHRSVFDTLDNWLHDSGPDQGAEVLARYFVEGDGMAVDYFFDGATTDSRWFGEDTGFWHFCHLNNIPVRYETRTRLGHIGLHVYGYPEQLPRSVTPYRGVAPYTKDSCLHWFRGFTCQRPPGHDEKHGAQVPGGHWVEWSDDDATPSDDSAGVLPAG